ncbi:unnamed protein product, partial [marine sediment metagenome]
IQLRLCILNSTLTDVDKIVATGWNCESLVGEVLGQSKKDGPGARE